MIREAENAHTDKISDKLKSGSISSRDWWTILKSFISPKTRSTVPPIEHNGDVYTEDQEKATLLNDFFSKTNTPQRSKGSSPWYTPTIMLNKN